MSKAYSKYLEDHIASVDHACDWIFQHCDRGELEAILPGLEQKRINFKNHDASKYTVEEYGPYDAYFYGKAENREEVKDRFNYAWLHHIHNNPHHWQYWILHNDDRESGLIALEMPDRFILEMICDWWSFSWRKGNLWELWNWWTANCDYIILGEKTRRKVIELLDLLNRVLMENEDVEGSSE